MGHNGCPVNVPGRKAKTAQSRQRDRALLPFGSGARGRHLFDHRRMELILTDQERRHIRSQFATSRCNLGRFTAYWIPGERRLTVRSSSITRAFELPAGAILIGTFDADCPTDDFLADLADVIRHSPECDPTGPHLPPRTRQRAAVT